MHTEFVQSVGSILAAAFFIGIMYFQLTTNTGTFTDTVIIGYVEKEDPVVINIQQIDQQLKQDCVDVLIKLGMKKGEARKISDSEFSSINPPKSVQEFLNRAL